MRNIVVGIGVAWCIMSCQAAHSEGPEPTCANCPGTYISVNELSEYLERRSPKDGLISKFAMSTSAKHESPSALCIAESSMRHCHILLLNMIKSVKCTMSSTDRGHLFLALISSTKSDARRMIRLCASSMDRAIMPRLFAMERAINSRPATLLLFRPVQDTGLPGLMTISITL